MNCAQGIDPVEYRHRRQRLMQQLAMDSVALVPAAAHQFRNGSNQYGFRQDSSFLYLTGFLEPDALLVLLPGREGGESILFCRDRELRAELFDGERAGPDRAAQLLGLDDAFPLEDLDDIVPGLLEGRKSVYYPLGQDPAFDRRVRDWQLDQRARVGAESLPDWEYRDSGHILHELRLRKSDAELRLMRCAARLSASAHVRAMQVAAPGLSEADVEAELRYVCHRGGAREQAYQPIVAAGANACTLHYVENSGMLRAGELLLIDAGCEYAGYAADITRTFPVSGQFTPLQREYYEMVLAAQRAAIDAARPGAHFNAPHEAAQRVLTEGLLRKGLLQGDLDELLTAEAARPYTLHKCSHWLGLDVHDVGDYQPGGSWRTLEPGMVMTIEPGLYFTQLVADVPPALRGLGIRIEDDVLITTDTPEVLTVDVPKNADEIEALMAGR